MKKITLGRTEESVSIISLGAWSHGKQNIDDSASVGWSNQSDQDSKDALLQSFSSVSYTHLTLPTNREV